MQATDDAQDKAVGRQAHQERRKTVLQAGRHHWATLQHSQVANASDLIRAHDAEAREGDLLGPGYSVVGGRR